MKKINAWFLLLLMILGPAAVSFAGSYDIKNMTPEVQQALTNRQQRYDELQRLKAAEEIGENNQGYTEVLKPGSASAIAAAENADRRVIYKTIVQQNGFGPGGLEQVQKAFAEVQHEKARPGDFVQSSSGEWRRK